MSSSFSGGRLQKQISCLRALTCYSLVCGKQSTEYEFVGVKIANISLTDFVLCRFNRTILILMCVMSWKVIVYIGLIVIIVYALFSFGCNTFDLINMDVHKQLTSWVKENISYLWLEGISSNSEIVVTKISMGRPVGDSKAKKQSRMVTIKGYYTQQGASNKITFKIVRKVEIDKSSDPMKFRLLD